MIRAKATQLALALALLFLVLLGTAPSAEARNPFLSKGGGASQVNATQQSETRPSSLVGGLTGRLTALVLPVQRQMHQRLSSLIQVYGREPALGRSLLLICLAFAYGLVHALGPGHGKSVASAYFISRPGTVRQGLLMGFATALAHALAAVAAVFAVRLVLGQGAASAFESAANRATQVSFALVGLIGLVMLAGSVRQALGFGRREADAPSPPGHYLKVALASGMIPCPGAAVILFFTLALGAPGLGLVAVGAMSLGMGLTVGAVAVFTVCCRGAMLRLSALRPEIWRGLYHGLAVAGSLAVFLLGFLLFLASLDL